MPYSLKDIPRTEFGDQFGIAAKDLQSSFALPSTALAQGQITPDKQGLAVWNATGGTLTAGTLVYVSGWNAANNLPQVSASIATGFQSRAQWVVLANIANGASGAVGEHFRFTGQNTSAAAVGDPVWLDVNAGGYTLTNPPAGGLSYQIVGRVVSAAASGIIDFDMQSYSEPVGIQTIQASFNPITIPTTGNPAARALICSRVAGTLDNVRVGGSAALATSDTNFITFGVINHGHTTGTGNTQMLNQASGNSTTKATGGGALVAFGGTALVPSGTAANLVIAINDVLEVQAVVTGTLANTVPDAWVRIGIIPTT